MKAHIPSEAMAIVLVDELVRNGIRHAVLAPGSRSAPVALALARDERIDVLVALDERSAAFHALGVAKATRRAAPILCTSGTAAANFYPAIQEAHQARVPMLVITADRPAELRDTGANQTLDQIKMFGDAVRWFWEMGVPEGQLDADPNAYWRSVTCRAVAECEGSPAGPVHLNLALREPLVATEGDVLDLDLEGRPGDEPWIVRTPSVALPPDPVIKKLAVELSGYERGILVAGAGDFDAVAFESLAGALGWPLLADPLSNVRHTEGVVSTYDALLRAEWWADEHLPDIVVRAGALGTSKVLSAFLTRVERNILVDRDGTFVDPGRTTTHLVAADPNLLFADLAGRIERTPGQWLSDWLAADEAATRAIDQGLATTAITEPAAARASIATLPEGSNLVVGASMPFRDVEWFGAPRAGVTFFGNRGANGIDGFVSTTLGIARGSERPTWGLCGDLTLLHDGNGFLLDGYDGPPVTFIVINNDGGGIFSFLPQADMPEHFEKLFGTPHGRSLEAFAAFHGLGFSRSTTAEELRNSIDTGSETIRIVEVPTDRAANVGVHRDLNATVAEALENLRHRH